MAGLPLLPTRDTPSQMRCMSTAKITVFKSFISFRSSRRLFQIRDTESEKEEEGVLVMIGAVAVPGSRIEEATGGAFDDLNAIADIPVLSEILIDRQLRQRKWDQHALNRRHAEEGDRLTGAERLDEHTHKIRGVFFAL